MWHPAPRNEVDVLKAYALTPPQPSSAADGSPPAGFEGKADTVSVLAEVEFVGPRALRWRPTLDNQDTTASKGQTIS
jgi:hypothetical protein